MPRFSGQVFEWRNSCPLQCREEPLLVWDFLLNLGLSCGHTPESKNGHKISFLLAASAVASISPHSISRGWKNMVATFLPTIQKLVPHSTFFCCQEREEWSLLPDKTFIFFYLNLFAEVKTSLLLLQNTFTSTASQAVYGQESNLYSLFWSGKEYNGSHRGSFCELEKNQIIIEVSRNPSVPIIKSYQVFKTKQKKTICRTTEVQIGSGG